MRGRGRARGVLFATCVSACLLGLTWPVAAWLGSPIEPYVLGLPRSLAWVLGWVVVAFLALVAYHATGEDERG